MNFRGLTRRPILDGQAAQALTFSTRLWCHMRETPDDLRCTLSFDKPTFRWATEQNSADPLDEPASSRRSTVKNFALLLFMVLGAVIGAGASANAKGCIKGAIVGGVAGHMAGHGAAGAAAGCVIGHHEANKRQKTNQNR
jgi:hypothetical protein